MQRFFLTHTELSQEVVIQDTDIIHQITKVLRLRFGENVIFFDGKSHRDFVYTFYALKKKSLFFRLQETFKKKSELDQTLCLYQAIPNKLEKLEYIVQKSSEVGFSRIVFFQSERSQKLVLSENKKQRLQKIMQEAIEQCGRNILCELVYQDTLSYSAEGLNIVFHQEKDKTSKYLRDLKIQKDQTVHIYV